MLGDFNPPPTFLPLEFLKAGEAKTRLDSAPLMCASDLATAFLLRSFREFILVSKYVTAENVIVSLIVMSQDTGGSTAGTISAYLGDPTNRSENRFNPTLNPVILPRSEVLEEDCKSDITTNLSAIVITTDN